MILIWPSGILKMSSHGEWSYLLKPLVMVEKSKTFPHLGMAKVMPVAEMGGIKAA